MGDRRLRLGVAAPGGIVTRRALTGVAVVAGSLIVAVAIAEVGLRIVGFSFAPYPRLYPEGVARGAAAGAFVADRDLLWVSSDWAPTLRAARANPPALLLLGDSCTAWGGWDARLAALVAEGGGNLSFANVAVGGWSSHQGLGALKRDLLALRPRVVTIWFGWNDHWTRWGIDDATATRIAGSGPLEGSRVVQLGQKLRIALLARRGADRIRVPPDAFRENLRAMVRLARERGAVPVLVTAPSAHERGEEPAFLQEEGYLADLDRLVPLHREYVAIVREVAASEGAVLCDPERDFPPPGPGRRLLFRPDGIHLADAGREAFAALLLETLRAHDLLKDVLEGGGKEPQFSRPPGR